MPRSVKERILPHEPIRRVMFGEEDDRWIADDAVEAMADSLVEIITEISSTAWDIVLHSGRKTIKARDIELAYKQYKKVRN